MDRPMDIAENRADVTRQDLLDAVERKQHELETITRHYQGNHRITNTVTVQQKSYPEKLLVLDEIGFDDGHQYRFAYWVVSDEKLKEGDVNVVFGQFASVIPPEDLHRLLKKAREHTWDGPGPLPAES